MSAGDKAALRYLEDEIIRYSTLLEPIPQRAVHGAVIPPLSPQYGLTAHYRRTLRSLQQRREYLLYEMEKREAFLAAMKRSYPGSRY